MYTKSLKEEVSIQMVVEDLDFSISAKNGVVFDNCYNNEIRGLKEKIGDMTCTALLMYVRGLVSNLQQDTYYEVFEIDNSRSYNDDSTLKIDIIITKSNATHTLILKWVDEWITEF